MTYKFDFFFSYKHFSARKDWAPETILPLLETYLYEQLGRTVTKFVDIDELSPDETRNEVLVASIGRALAQSRTMVAVWDRTYFYSIWCWNECRSFVRRIGEDSSWKPILPVIINNGDLFPRFARAMPSLNVSDCTTTPGSPFYKEFQERIRKGAKKLSEAIQAAPEWNPKWTSTEWFSEEPPAEIPLQQLPRL